MSNWQMKRVACAIVAGAMLAGCSSPNRSAPVIDRSAGMARGAPVVTEAGAIATPTAPVTTGNDVPTYVVKPGDTLYSIATSHGRDVHDLQVWNQIDDPRSLRVGQTLRLGPPGGDAAVAANSSPRTSAIEAPRGLETRPLGPSPALPSPKADTPPLAKADPQVPANDARINDSGIAWLWPAKGDVLGTFKEPSNKGIDIAAKVGDPVVAAADGRVIFAGQGPRGYGILVIVKHNDRYLSAYAHNSKALVATDANVKRGQKIAEAGNSDADRPKVHFEIRKQGVPVDPLKYLPDKAS